MARAAVREDKVSFPEAACIVENSAVGEIVCLFTQSFHFLIVHAVNTSLLSDKLHYFTYCSFHIVKLKGVGG